MALLALPAIAILYQTVDAQTVQWALEQVGTLVANHIKVVLHLECQVASTLTHNLVEQSLLVAGKVLVGVALYQSFQTNAGTYGIHILDGLGGVVVGLQQCFGISQIDIAQHDGIPLWLFAAHGLANNVFQHAVACTILSGVGLRGCTYGSAANPHLPVGTAGASIAPVQGLAVTVDHHCLVESWVAGVLQVLQHLLTFHGVALHKHIVELAFLLGLVPIEWGTISPGEHLYIFLSGAIGITVVTAATIGFTSPTKVVPTIVVTMCIVAATDAVQNFRTVLQDVAAAESVTVVLLGGAKWLHQVIMTVGVHLRKEIGTGLLELLPQFGLAATIPGASVGLGGVLALPVRLAIVEQWRSSKLQHLALQCHGASQCPVSGF